MRNTLLGLVFVTLVGGCAHARACPNQSASVTIPMTGVAVVTIYDSATCNALQGPFTISAAGFTGVLGTATKPAFTIDAGGNINFAANGAPFGTKLSGTVTFLPDPSKTMPLAIVVGGAVTGLVGGTTTP